MDSLLAAHGQAAVDLNAPGRYLTWSINFGQMLLWHVVLIPILLISLVGAHVLLVRVRGPSRGALVA